MSIETKAKALVALHKKEQRKIKELEQVRKEISQGKIELNKTFTSIGLSSSFSS